MATDDNYAQHLGVCIVSIFENNSNRSFFIHVFSSDISISNRRKIESIALRYKQSVVFHEMSIEDFKDFPIESATNSYYSNATLFRLKIGDLLDKNIERVLYLDSDIIVCGDIGELFDINMYGAPIAAVKDTPWMLDFAEKHLGISKDAGYYNAGVLLIDLNLYRNARIWEQSLELVRSETALPYLDQDILNLVFKNRWLELPCKWNILNGCLRKMYLNDACTRFAEYKEGITGRRIIHYSAKEKPWSWRCYNPLKEEYYKYLKISPWNGFTPNRTLRQWLSLAKHFILSIDEGYVKDLSRI